MGLIVYYTHSKDMLLKDSVNFRFCEGKGSFNCSIDLLVDTNYIVSTATKPFTSLKTLMRLSRHLLRQSEKSFGRSTA